MRESVSIKDNVSIETQNKKRDGKLKKTLKKMKDRNNCICYFYQHLY